METRKIRWGVLGYARIARETVIPAILRAANAEFTAIASREPSKLAECQARYPVAKTCVGYEALLADPEVDAIYIPLPNSLHRAWTIQAAARGKHVLCEKPLGLTAADVRDMIAAAAGRGVLLMEAFMYRYTERTRLVREIVRAGTLGEIKHISSTFRFLLNNPASIKLQPALGGGALYDIGCYPLNFIGMIADLSLGGSNGGGAAKHVQPVAVTATADRVGGIDMNLSALLRYANGMTASAHCGFNAHKRVVAEIIGTKAVLEIPDTFFDNAGSLALTIGEDRAEIAVGASDRYRSEIEDFSDAILQGRRPQFPLEESLRNAEVLDRVLAASR